MTDEAPRAADLLERLPWYTVPGLLVGVPLLALLIGKVSSWFQNAIIWRYYWGPIVADAEPGTDSLCSDRSIPLSGVCPPGHVVADAGYNLVNTISWAVLLGICIVGIAQMLLYFRTPADNKLILGAAAWVVTGAVWHVLQDSKLIAQPLEFIFITPPIYLLFGAFGILSFLYGQYARMVAERTGSLESGLQKIWFLFTAVTLAYTFLWVAKWDQIVVYVNPVWIALFAVATFAVVRWRVNKLGRIDASEMTLIFSLGWFLTSIAYVWSYLQDPWPGKVPDDSLRYAFIIAPALAAAVTAIVYVVAKKLQANGNKAAFAYLMPINLVLIFSQMVDAFATAIGIDLSTYEEKHLLSELVRRTTEAIGGVAAKYPTFLGFATIKLLVSLLVVYAIDVSSKDDAKKYPTLIGLVKFAIIMVGIGPGVRNMVRMSLGI